MLKPFPLLLGLLALAPAAHADDFLIDAEGAHAFIHFKISHLGYSWLLGRFNRFEGRFSYDENDPAGSQVTVTVDVASIDSNHAERDKHLRGERFLDAARYPQARFASTGFSQREDGTAALDGDFTLHGVTRPLRIEVRPVGHGMDPWGGYRRGFEGDARIRLKDYGIDYDLGPAAREVALSLYVEGIRERAGSSKKPR